MKKLWKEPKIWLLFIFVFVAIIFSPGFSTYFHQDDFLHLEQSQTPRQLIGAFNLFSKGEFPFYRPIPTQLDFCLGQRIFSLNPFGYHVINFIVFFINIILVYILVSKIVKNKTVGSIASLFFAINSTHFPPLYSPAYVHELLYVFFGLLVVTFYLSYLSSNKLYYYFYSLICFVLALMTKETAVILPGILFLCNILLTQKNSLKELIKRLLPFAAILFIYLFGHVFYYGLAQNTSYQVIIGKQNLNILFWYFLWALSVPNILIDFIGPGLKINPVFFAIGNWRSYLFITLIPILLSILFFLILRTFQLNNKLLRKYIILGIGWFVIGLIPLIIFPLHKLATEQAFSLVGLSLILGVSVYFNLPRHKYFALLFSILFLIMATNSIILARKTHWIVRSANQAKNTIDYIQTRVPFLKDSDIIYFKNGEVKLPTYGSSKQIYYALGNGVGLKIIFAKPNLRLYFEDINILPKKLKSNNIIIIDSSKLLGY